MKRRSIGYTIGAQAWLTFPMTQKQKLLQKVLSESNNIAFDDIVTLVQAFGFRLSRVNGSHHIFENTAIGEPINFQNKKGKAKPYQIKQFL